MTKSLCVLQLLFLAFVVSACASSPPDRGDARNPVGGTAWYYKHTGGVPPQ